MANLENLMQRGQIKLIYLADNQCHGVPPITSPAKNKEKLPILAGWSHIYRHNIISSALDAQKKRRIHRWRTRNMSPVNIYDKTHTAVRRQPARHKGSRLNSPFVDPNPAVLVKGMMTVPRANFKLHGFNVGILKGHCIEFGVAWIDSAIVVWKWCE